MNPSLRCYNGACAPLNPELRIGDILLETVDVRLDVAVVVDMDAVGTVAAPVDAMLSQFKFQYFYLIIMG